MKTKQEVVFSQTSSQQGSLREEQLVGWLTLVRDTRFSITQKQKLLSIFTHPIEIYRTPYRDLCVAVGAKVNSKKESLFKTKLQQGLDQDLYWLQQPNNYLVCWGDDNYPKLLAQISDPPVCLFASGCLSYLNEPKISVVGSRRPTPVGGNITKSLASELARLGVVICSGMALGIDAISHKSALDVGEPTIAVMGSGLDIISPVRHRQLFEQISHNGLVLSEYPIGYPASKYTFPQRNRIVSGLSYGVVIVEAADKSGTLITARLAMEQNRDVFVVPGSPINPQYTGSHRLIRQGAILTTSAEDILIELSGVLQKELLRHSVKPNGDLPNMQKKQLQALEFPVLEHIYYEPMTINQIILSSGLTASEVSSMLLILEIEGLVAVTPEGSYIRVS